jgi:hypothetical protein
LSLLNGRHHRPWNAYSSIEDERSGSAPGAAAPLRSRDSLGNDLPIGPGGIVWPQAECGRPTRRSRRRSDASRTGPDRCRPEFEGPVRRAPDTLAQTGSDAGVAGRRRGPRAGRHRVVRRRLVAARTPAEPFDLLDAGPGAAPHTRHTGYPSAAVRVGGISGRVGEAIGLRDTGRFFRIPAIVASPLGNAAKVPCWRKNESEPVAQFVVSSAEDRS